MAGSFEVVVDWFVCCSHEDDVTKFVTSGIDSIKKLRDLEKDQFRKIEPSGWMNERFRILQDRTSTEEELSQEGSNISLFAACKRGQLNRVEMLMENGRADKNWHNPYSSERTPLIIASSRGHTAVVELLVGRGARVNDTDVANYTALHWCARKGHDDISRYLIKHNANVNAVDMFTQTPAHCTAKYGHLNVLKVLHQHGADLSLRDWDNNTPLDLSQECNQTAVTAYLKSVANEPTLPQPSPSPSPPPSPPSPLPSRQPSAQPSSTSEEEQHTPDHTISEDTTPDFLVDDDTAHKVLEQEVGVSTADLMLAGSPGSGKTSVMHLSLNEPPPNVRNSTGCVETPVRAIASGTIYADGTMMKKLETEEMLDMVCGALRHKIENNIRRDYEEHVNTEIHRPVSSTATPTPTQASLEDSPRQDVAVPPKADNAAKQEVPTPHTPATAEEKLKVFAKLMKEVSSVKASPDFLSATLVSTTDSGGQPQFMDACSLLLRSNSLFMITVKLNERLDDKPKFDFFINGKPISMCSISLQLTNLQLIESIAKTVSSIQLSTANTGEDGSESRQAKFMLIGTFADKADECEGETIADKNRILKERLKHFKAELVDNGGDIIFPVNAVTTNPDERQKAALQLQDIITNTPGTSINAKIKLRWFGLLMHMLDVAKKKDISILRLDEIIAAGKCLMMSEEETRQAVKRFHDMNLVNHYHHSTEKLDQLVFVNVKPILDQLTNLIGIAFIDKHMLDEIFKTKVPINAQERLRDYGQFSQSLLDSCFSFPAPFTAEVFLDILEHLSMIARIEIDGQTAFFLPSALPHAPEDILLEKEQVSATPWILRLEMRRDTIMVDIPIPKGYLPTLVICLITFKMFEADAKIRQYRDLMGISYVGGGHVYFIERSHQLEIYYSWDEEFPNHCSVIRSEIMKALVEAEKKLRFKPDILTKEDVFICSCNGSHPRHFCTYKSIAERAICEKNGKPRHLSKQQQCWILPTPSQVKTPPTHHSSGEQYDTPPTADQAAASRPTMKELVRMRKKDSSKGKLEIIEWITAHELTKCVDFAHTLLPALPVKKLCTKYGDNKEEFVRAVLQKWIDKDDDDDEDDESPLCTWNALVKCCEDAKLDGKFVNLLRDYIPK